MSYYYKINLKFVNKSTNTEFPEGYLDGLEPTVYCNDSTSGIKSPEYVISPGDNNLVKDNLYLYFHTNSTTLWGGFIVNCAQLESGWQQQKIGSLPAKASFTRITSTDYGSSASNPIVAEVLFRIDLENYYIIRFDTNGSGETVAPMVCHKSSNVKLPTATRDGYNFLGWSDGTTTYEAGTWYGPPPGDITLIAVWSDAAELNFDANGGTGAPATIHFQTGDTITIPDAKPTRAGYIFAGWATDPSGVNVEYFTKEAYRFTAAATLYAAWRRPLQIVAYSSDVIDQDRNIFTADHATSENLPEGMMLLPSISPYVYVVTAGYKDGSFENEDPDSWLYVALDKSGNYTLSSISGTIGSSSSVIREVDRQVLSSRHFVAGGIAGPGFTRIVFGIDIDALNAAGYEFVGWFYGEAIRSSDQYNATYATIKKTERLVSETDASMSPSRIPKIAPIVTQRVIYTITFDANGGTGAPGPIEVSQSSGTWTCPSEEPIKDKHIFIGWATAPAGGRAEYFPGNTYYNLNASMTLYAIWDGNYLLLIFNAYGGHSPVDYKMLGYGDKYGELPVPTRDGWTFAGWFTDPTGGEQVSSETVFLSDANVVVYARWTTKRKHRTIYFEPNGGVCDIAQMNVIGGEAIGTLPTPTRVGHTFVGWFRSTIGNSEITADTLADDVDMYVYAHWDKTMVTITFDANGGQVSEESRTIPYGQKYLALPTPVLAGKSFAGWFTAPDGGIAVTSATIATESMTIYAQWVNSSADWGYAKFRIFLKTDGGVVSSSYGELYYIMGKSKALPTADQMTKSGYTFSGWYASADYSGEVITTIPDASVGSRTYYAKWS